MQLNEQGKDKLVRWAKSGCIDQFPELTSNDFEDAVLVTNLELSNALDFSHFLLEDRHFDNGDDASDPLEEKMTRVCIRVGEGESEEFCAGYSEFKDEDMPDAKYIRWLLNDVAKSQNPLWWIWKESLQKLMSAHIEKTEPYIQGIVFAEEVKSNINKRLQLRELYLSKKDGIDKIVLEYEAFKNKYYPR